MATIAEAVFRTQKDVLKLTIGDDDAELTINMLPPTKEMYEDMATLCGIVARVASGESDEVNLHELLGVVAHAMSNNTSLTRITGDYLESIGFDMVDVLEFASAFTYFVSELAKSKN